MIKVAIREFILNAGDKEDALKLLEQIENFKPEQVAIACEELRAYLESDSCGLPGGDQKVSERREYLLSSTEAERIYKGDSGDEEFNEMDEVE